MAYIRKTEDLYTVQGYFTDGWEDCTSDPSRKLAIANLKEYRKNAPEYPYRLVWQRIRKVA